MAGLPPQDLEAVVALMREKVRILEVRCNQQEDLLRELAASILAHDQVLRQLLQKQIDDAH